MKELQKLSELTGYVYDEKGRAVAGVKVYCDDVESTTLFDGSFRFVNLSPGSHVLSVHLEGYGAIERRIETGEGEVFKVDLQLEPQTGKGKIYGYVFDAETAEHVKEGGMVFLVRHTYNLSASIDPRTGYYEFNNLPAGNYKIGISLLDYHDEFKFVNIKDAEEKREDFYCMKKEDVEPPWG